MGNQMFSQTTNKQKLLKKKIHKGNGRTFWKDRKLAILMVETDNKYVSKKIFLNSVSAINKIKQGDKVYSKWEKR